MYALICYSWIWLVCKLFNWPSPSFLSLAVRLSGRGPGTFLMWMMSWTRQIMQTWTSRKPPTTSFACTRALLFGVERWQHTKVILCRSLWDSWEDREFYQGKTVKTHSSIVIIFARVPVFLPSCYLWHHSCENVPGPLPLNHTANVGKLGEGLGMRLHLKVNGLSHVLIKTLWKEAAEHNLVFCS